MARNKLNSKQRLCLICKVSIKGSGRKYCSPDCAKKASIYYLAIQLKTLRTKIIDMLGGECIICGMNDYRILQFDHINGNGNSHRKSFNSVVHFYKNIIEEKGKGIQLLCPNCNWIKRLNEHPTKGNLLQLPSKIR